MAGAFFDPQAHTSRRIASETVIRGLRPAQQAADAEPGLRSQLIMCFLRHLPADPAMHTLENSPAYRDRIAGAGLDPDEKGNPPVKFREISGRARDEGYHLTMHGDADQQDSATHTWQCLDDIGAERIDHGVNCLENDALVQRLKSSAAGLTACPIPDSYVTGSLKARQIKTMLDRSLLVTINSDDPAYFPDT